ncbi:unnamed protein product [Ectocarpus sp. CCAP 1310/34]|nr:unnamed protein product [Ectocarpus sp. CCAP 1310/34]
MAQLSPKRSGHHRGYFHALVGEGRDSDNNSSTRDDAEAGNLDTDPTPEDDDDDNVDDDLAHDILQNRADAASQQSSPLLASGGPLEAVLVSAVSKAVEAEKAPAGMGLTEPGGTVVCASTKTQPVTAQSTTEAEYIAAGEGAKEALFVRGVLSFIAPETSGATIRVREDNEGALALVQNPFSSARSKHIDVRFHFIRELVKAGKITADNVSTEEQHADMLTKVLGRGKLEYHRKALMNLPM